MRSLSFIVFIVGITVNLYSQDPHGEDFDLDCETCHETESWKINPLKIKFEHSSTQFELTGQHQTTDCRNCHSTLVFSLSNSDCISCHTDLHQGTVGKDCSKCHTPDSWIVEDINNIHQTGRFPLLGKHLVTDCVQCHNAYVDLVFEPLNTDCYNCHSTDYLSTSSPNHTNAGFSTDCEDCHPINAFSWTAINVVHDFFPLVEGHNISDCFTCHEQGGGFSGLSSECYSCHQQDYESVNDPNHVLGNFPTDCSQCHTISAWIPASFDHSVTAFPLTGKHIDVDCADCHTTGFSGTPTDCYACHQSDYENVSDPNHVSAGFSTDCLECHTTAGWDGANFDHNITGFELTGAHIGVDCLNCHSNGFTNTPTDCFSCHEENYNNTSNPNHIAANFPTACDDCHSTSAWQPAAFDHTAAGFELVGAHTLINCDDCHNGNYNNTPNTCMDCHNDDFNNTNNPPHQSLGFSEDCLICHNMNGWIPASFNHAFFPISSPHNEVNCNECHSEPNYQPQCMSCHGDDFLEEHDPGDPTDCWNCHTSFDWSTGLRKSQIENAH